MQIQSLRFENMSFGHNPNQLIFENVSFALPMGKNVWLSGPGGSGKSSAMRILAALSFPTSGDYFVNDLNVNECSFEEFLPYRLRMGFATDYGGLLSNMTIYENILLPMRYHKREDHKLLNWANEVVEILELGDFKNKRPAFVTGAVRKAACIARAMVLHPEVIFFDNPTESLDRVRRMRLIDLIEKGRCQRWLHHVFISGSDNGFCDKLNCEMVSIANKNFVGSQGNEVCAI